MISLREICRDDIPIINRWRQDPVVTDGICAPHRFIGLEVDLAWYDDYLTRRDREVRCAVCLEDSRELVGMVSLTRIDAVHRNAEFHVIVGERRAQKRGVGTAATCAILRHGLFDLNLHRIYTTVLRHNIASIRVCEKAGFKQEGIIRDGAYKNGRYHDLVLMGVLKHDIRATEGAA